MQYSLPSAPAPLKGVLGRSSEQSVFVWKDLPGRAGQQAVQEPVIR